MATTGDKDRSQVGVVRQARGTGRRKAGRIADGDILDDLQGGVVDHRHRVRVEVRDQDFPAVRGVDDPEGDAADGNRRLQVREVGIVDRNGLLGAVDDEDELTFAVERDFVGPGPGEPGRIEGPNESFARLTLARMASGPGPVGAGPSSGPRKGRERRRMHRVRAGSERPAAGRAQGRAQRGLGGRPGAGSPRERGDRERHQEGEEHGPKAGAQSPISALGGPTNGGTDASGHHGTGLRETDSDG